MFPVSASFAGGVYNQEMANAEFNAVATRVKLVIEISKER